MFQKVKKKTPRKKNDAKYMNYVQQNSDINNKLNRKPYVCVSDVEQHAVAI